MGIVDPELLLKLSDLWGPLGIALLAIVLPTAALVAVKPHLFWQILLASSILGVGPRIKGYMLADELMLGAVLIGALLHVGVRRPKRAPAITRLERLLFLGWSTYMIAQSCVGIFVNDDPRILRWLLLYSMLGATYVIVRSARASFPFPGLRRASMIIVVSTFVAYAAYLGQGMYFDADLGLHGRFLSQDYVWAGSAY